MFEPWKLKDFDVGGGLAAGAAQGGDDGGWIDTTVPGDTHLALQRAGRIGDPFLGRNEAAAAWIEGREWWWRTRFEAALPAAGERVELLFEGLDTFASIYLNGRLLGATDNMFRAWRFEVGALLRAAGGNELAICFAPATASVAHQPQLLWPMAAEKIAASRRNLMRKAQFGWGWDWGPNLPTVGVWQPVRIERHQQARIAALRFATVALGTGHAELRIDLALEHLADAKDLQATIRLFDPNRVLLVEQTVAIEREASLTLKIADPQLWWTADLGAQPLYQLEAELHQGPQPLDSAQRTVGIRTLTLDTSDDPAEPGSQFFRFVLNGVPLFARGACWIPASSFVAEVAESRYRALLEDAVRANMNMMRVWGGGIYEADAFYAHCDRLGLLVWQDFMFACAPYPQSDTAFVDNVRQEVTQQVRRLRHHACLALWCGNNESQVIQHLINSMGGGQTALEGRLYYDEIIPAVLANEDAVTPYWPGSPWGGSNPNSMKSGDVHDWMVWHGFPPVPDQTFVGELDRSPEGVAYTRYAEDSGRFISEFGIHGAPAMQTLRRWMDADDLKLGSEGFLDRIKDHPKDKVNGMLIPVTGLPQTLEQYIDYTMLVQAEGLKFGIEHFRRRKPHCAGALIWQFNDCWPCISWSLVDYDGVAKASYHATARAFSPLLASFKVVGEQAELWITNDRLRVVSGTAEIAVLRFAGGQDWQVLLPYSLPANSSQRVWRGRVPQGALDRVLCVRDLGSAFPENRHLLAPVKDLQLAPGAAPQMTVTQQGPHELEVVLQASSYLLMVQLESPVPGSQFSDNHFDLRPGVARHVTIRNSASPLSPQHLSVRCWNQQLP
ncbi:MAG: glycoside hydrolase family 2 protein [Pseudomonadota bacterium]